MNEHHAWFYRVPSRPKRKCRSYLISLRPELRELLNSDFPFATDRSLPEIATALHNQAVEIDHLRSLLGTGVDWAGELNASVPFHPDEAVSFKVRIRDLGTCAVATFDSPDGNSQVVVVVPEHRLGRATPKCLYKELGFLDAPVLGNIRRETWRQRHGAADASLVFCTNADKRGTDFQGQLRALEFTGIAASVAWLIRRDAFAYFAAGAARKRRISA
jgi:hypothetical protein